MQEPWTRTQGEEIAGGKGGTRWREAKGETGTTVIA